MLVKVSIGWRGRQLYLLLKSVFSSYFGMNIAILQLTFVLISGLTLITWLIS